MQVNCLVCQKEFKAKPSLVAKGKSKFCSRDCCNKNQQKGTRVKCNTCEKEVWRCPSDLKSSKYKVYFCSISCRNKSKMTKASAGPLHPSWRGGNKTYRKRAIEAFGAKCQSAHCEITDAEIKIDEWMLDVDHKNGDRTNNTLDNLQVLCVWCHTRKTREK